MRCRLCGDKISELRLFVILGTNIGGKVIDVSLRLASGITVEVLS
jgi:hypothetical protein